MVDISERLAGIHRMIENGDYFCINRGRQYGKTTTLEAIQRMLQPEYLVLSISFEGLGQSNMATDDAVARLFVKILDFQMRYIQVDPALKNVIREAVTQSEPSLMDLSLTISDICSAAGKPVVLLIDEVDNASNYESFLHFLGMLRNKYLDRMSFPTFQSVILAGVYDIKNLKLKIRGEQEHLYNSLWNMAVPYDEDMSLHTLGIADMLREYALDRAFTFDAEGVAQQIYDYTSGYPFLVSRLCQIVDQKQYTWDKQGVIDAVHDILMERNTLFEDHALEAEHNYKDSHKNVYPVGNKIFESRLQLRVA